MPNGKEKIDELIREGRRITDAKEAARAAAESELALNGASQDYLRLVRSLVRREQLLHEHVEKIATSPFPINPCDVADFTDGFSEQERSAQAKAGKAVIKKNLNWPAIQKLLPTVINDAETHWEAADKARIETAPLASLRSVGAFWCGLFDHAGWFPHIRVPDLDFAYRGPSLFLSEIRKNGAEVAFLLNDERITQHSLRSHAGEIGKASLVYLCTHGKCPPSGYEAYLHQDKWHLGKAYFNAGAPNVLVFDTCNLIEADHGWENSWADVLRGGSVHLLLGFKGLTSIDPASSRRGTAFAENLSSPKKMSHADAWIAAVDRTAVTRNSRAVAIGVGKTPTDAESKLRLTMDDTSTPHKVAKVHSGPLFFAVKDLHETRVSDTAF